MKVDLIPITAGRRLLDEGRHTRAMRNIMAIMLFLTVLAAALGLAMFNARGALDRQLSGRLTVQILEPNFDKRDQQASAIVAKLDAMPGVARVAAVSQAELNRLLEPWLGGAAAQAELPMPALIDVDLATGDAAAVARVEQAARAIAPSAQVDRHSKWLGPVHDFLAMLSWVAVAVVLLMALATTAVVLLSARAGLDTHRQTISVLHMLGSTDVQIARLFQRRIAIDMLIGGALGTAAAMLAILFLGTQVATLGSELLNGLTLSHRGWAALAFLPVLFAVIGTLAARRAVLRALAGTL